MSLDSVVQEAYVMAHTGNPREALSALDKLVAENPDSSFAAYSKAKMMIDLLPPFEADVAVRWFEQRFSSDPLRHILKARVLERDAKLAEALTEYERYTAQAGPDDDTVASTISLLWRLARRDEADEMLTRWNGPRISVVRYQLHPPQSTKEVEDMVGALREIGSDEGQVIMSEVLALRSLNELDLARARLEVYLESKPNLDWAILALAKLEYEGGQHQIALQRAKRLFEADPANVEVTRFLSRCFAHRFNLIAAFRVLLRNVQALRNSPAYPSNPPK